MKTRITAAAVAVVAAALWPLNAAEAGSKSGTYQESVRVSDTCTTGATCSGSATATADGVHTVAAAITRETRSTTTREASQAIGAGSQAYQLKRGARELRVTFTWHVEEADGRAAPAPGSTEGATISRLFARGVVSGCSDCVQTHSTDDALTDLIDSQGAPQEGEVHDLFVTHTVTVRRPDGATIPAGRYHLEGRTWAFTYVGMACDVDRRTEENPDGCTAETVGHAGTAELTATTKLLSIEVATS